MNAEFQHWIERSGLAKKELARRVQRRAHAGGLNQVSTNPSRIRGWLNGQQPAGDVAEVVAAVLGEACRHPLTPTMLGFTSQPNRRPVIDLSGSLDQIASELDALVRGDLLVAAHDVDSQRHALVTGSALTEPLQAWVIGSGRPAASAARSAGDLVAMEDAQLLAEATDVFRNWDNAGRGGLRRRAVTGQLADALTAVRGRFDSPTVRGRYLLAVADLAQLAGWMSYDVGYHAVAQQYYRLGLQLSSAADDRLHGARMLYCMARQLIEVERADDALDVLDLALYGTTRHPTPRVRTLLLGMRARALANLSSPDPAECERTIDAAREAFASTTGADAEPAWASFYDRAELAGVAGAAYRDLAMHDLPDRRRYAVAAEAATREAIDLRGDGFGRSRVLDLTNLTAAYLLMDEPGQAAAHGTRAIELAGRVRSSRITNRLRATSRMAAHRLPNVAELREFHEQVRTTTVVERSIAS